MEKAAAQVTFRIERTLHEKLTADARARDVTRAEAVRDALWTRYGHGGDRRHELEERERLGEVVRREVRRELRRFFGEGKGEGVKKKRRRCARCGDRVEGRRHAVQHEGDLIHKGCLTTTESPHGTRRA